MKQVLAAALVLALAGCVQVYDTPAPVAAEPALGPYDDPDVVAESPATSRLGPWGGDQLLDDDPPGELYKDESILDDDVGVLDYYLIPPGL